MPVFVGLIAIAAAYWIFLRASGPGPRQLGSSSMRSALDQITSSLTGFFSTVSVEHSMSYEQAYRLRGKYYESIITAAELKHGLPAGLLMRMAWAESSFRPDAVGQTTRYGTAKGMFQLIDTTAEWLKVDPFNVASAADGAGRYMKYLYGRFASWPLAVAAYNWGEGNLSNALKGTKNAPRETIDYVAKILGHDLVALIDARRGGVMV